MNTIYFKEATMPTKTKPKKPIDPYIIPIKLNARDKKSLHEMLELKSEITIENFINILEEHLTLHANHLRKILKKPHPQHIVAELAPIFSLIKKLRQPLHPNKMTNEARRVIGSELCEKAWLIIEELYVSLGLAIERNQENSSCGGGALRQLKREYLESIKIILSDLYSHHAAEEPDKGEKKEFLSICLPYLG